MIRRRAQGFIEIQNNVLIFLLNGLSEEKCLCRWCWGRLVAKKPTIYYSKCPFWILNLIFGAPGRLKQHENFMKKHLNVCKTLNAFGSVLKVLIRFIQLLGKQ